MILLAVATLGSLDRTPGYLLTATLFLLPHLLAAHVAMTFCVWVVLPDRRGVPATVCIALLGWGWLWGPSLADWGSDPPASSVRVGSWNVQRLWGLGDAHREQARACVVDVVREHRPDVITFLEVSREDTDLLAADLDLECRHTPYHEDGNDRHGGLAVCATQSVAIAGRPQRFVDSEDWHYVFAELRRDGTTFNVLAVHLWPYRLGGGRTFTRRIAAAQANQSRALLQRVSRFRDPTVVAGDFNSTRDFHLHRSLRSHLQDAWEVAGLGFGATKFVKGVVPLRIDFIYASPTIEVHDTWVPQVNCSDHLPVFTDLSL